MHSRLARMRIASALLSAPLVDVLLSPALFVLFLLSTAALLGMNAWSALRTRQARQQAQTLSASLAQAQSTLAHYALHDPLTDLPNRVVLTEKIERAIAHAQCDRSAFAVIVVDIDDFKSINDDYGHATGDALLATLASRMRKGLRADDCVARLGGDGFIIIAAVGASDDAAQVCRRLLAMVRLPVQLEDRPILISASLGVSMYPRDGDDVYSLITTAQAAMRRSKRSSRGSFTLYGPSLLAHERDSVGLSQDLRLALERKELVLHYQPKFCAPNGPVIGAEALIRWQHPRLGLMPPDRFIPLAEKTGMIVPIGHWVITEACAQMRKWIDMGFSEWTIAVNLSTLQFMHDDLVDTVERALMVHSLPARCLTVEITESTAMHDVKASLNVLSRLSSLGVSISIDDFGTGHSSLLYLSRLQANELKIDRGFVEQLDARNPEATIVTAIVAMARKLGMHVVAEGVETEDQKNLLIKLGCDSLQGFLLGPPVPGHHFTATHASLS